jgi:hypothetical protein
MHDAIRTRYGKPMCRRPPDGADLPPHYKHGRLSRPQPFADAATVTIAALTTPNVIVCVGTAKLASRKRCGDHLVAAYLAKVNAIKRQFLRLAANGRN